MSWAAAPDSHSKSVAFAPGSRCWLECSLPTRAFRDVSPLYERPAILDTTAIHALLGAIRVTPYEEAIRRTLSEVVLGAADQAPP